MGQQSYQIVINAGKEVGAKGGSLIKIVISEDGGMLTNRLGGKIYERNGRIFAVRN